MGIGTKKYIGLFMLAFLLGGLKHVGAQNDAVSIRCVAVDSAGDVTLTWVAPSPAALSADGATGYTIDTSSVSNSPNSSIAIGINTAFTSYLIPYTSLPKSPNSEPIYFNITTNNTNVNTNYTSSTVSTIFLTITNNIGTAQLTWNPISTPLPQGSSKWYQIWREYQYVWSLVDSTQNPSYIDTITYCDSTYLKYQVRIADSTICTSTSNIAGSKSKFIEQFGPPQVVMDTVSVTPGDSVDITWAKSSKKNVVGYIIYVYNYHLGGYQDIDTVWGINTDSLLYYTGGGNPSDSSITFAVAALDGCGKVGAISNPQNTLFLQVKHNLCAQFNTLTWNSYEFIAGEGGYLGIYGIGGYKVFYSVNSGPFQLLASLGKNVRSYTDSNLHRRELRCYYVQVYDSASIDTTASSNIIRDSILPPPPPKNNYLRTATVLLNTSSIQIVGYIDTLSGAEYYAFQRSDSGSGFETIYTMNAPRHTDSISYIDNSANPTLRSYYYQISTLDSCKKTIDSTNVGQTMHLTAVGQTNGTNTLTWNDYRNWYTGPSYYQIYRSEDGVNYTFLSPPIMYSSAGQNTYIDNISGITNGQGTFYYYIKAVENNSAALYPFTDTSLSNVAEAYQDPIVYIPDAFSPNGKNNIFIPVGVFIDVQGYDFSIFDRWGTRIFESIDPVVGWNGRDGGKVVQQGIYIYLLTFTSSKGEYFQRTGTVTLLK